MKQRVLATTPRKLLPILIPIVGVGLRKHTHTHTTQKSLKKKKLNSTQYRMYYSSAKYKDKETLRVSGVYTSRGKKPPKEGTSAPAVLSVFTLTTTYIW